MAYPTTNEQWPLQGRLRRLDRWRRREAGLKKVWNKLWFIAAMKLALTGRKGPERLNGWRSLVDIFDAL